ncbi:MAG: assimilatory sulfite reductase (NADPH) flavoprotein subunit [Pseudomonadota bacterium]
MAESMILVPVRTSRQGTSLNAGKLKEEYQTETSTAEIHEDDMARLGLKKGDRIRLRSEYGAEVVVSCKSRKGADASPGLIFMAYGPTSSQLMEDDTAGTGMPLSKHIAVDVEGPLTSDGAIAPHAPSVPSGMPMVGGPLSEQQSALLNALASSSLTQVQAAWLSGYFAAMSGQAGAIPADLAAGRPAAVSNLPLMTILFGSQTGNGEGLANTLKDKASALGYNVSVEDMADYDPARLENERLLFIIVSTHGEGDPPMAAETLHEYLKEGGPRLENLRYAVFALGDSSYEKFCQTGKDFDRFLSDLGASPLFDRVDSDIDFEEAAEAWTETVLQTYQSIAEEEGGTLQPSATVLDFPGKGKPQYGKTNPYSATVNVNRNLSGSDSAKENRHIEIDLGDSGLTYEPGDALGVYPLNNPAYVEELLSALKMDSAKEVTVAKETLSLHEAFLRRLDITALSRVIMEKYAALIDSPELKTLLDDEHSEQFKDYIWGRQILDLVEDYPPGGVSEADVVGILRKMPGRLYSIASSLKAHPNQVHVLVGAVRYHSHDRDREGVCSTFLAGRVDAGDQVDIYVQQNKSFRLPTDNSTPIIMVGPGTGLAPFRAFLQEREAEDATGKSWLFFGDQHKATDFLYEDEWEKMLEKGSLTRIDTAFSRDQAQKVYVQHRILENANELFTWLEEGAHFYVCGDAARMAGDVHNALLEVISKEGGKTAEEAEKYLKALQDAKRYQRDVY